MKDPYRYFRVEAREIAEALSQCVLAFERAGGAGTAGADAIAQMLRLAHTLKGAARVVGRADIAELSHALEGELARQRDAGTRGEAPARTDIESLLARVDAIAGLVSAIGPPSEAPAPGTFPPPAALAHRRDAGS